MIFNEHSNIPEGSHAFLGASKFYWLKYPDEKLVESYYGSYATTIGTLIHEMASDRIKYNLKVRNTKDSKDNLMLWLLKNGIPRDAINIDKYFNNYMAYVNDAIGYRMTTEQLLVYSPLCFGTADAISFKEKENKLRIHDLKTGTTPAHMEQLEIYAALFFLEYKKFKPENTDVELRIYQSDEVLVLEPVLEDIQAIMERIVEANKILMNVKGEE